MLVDNIILISWNSPLNKEELIDQYQSCSPKANFRKTISGAIGEFLRKVYALTCILEYLILDLKSIMYRMISLTGNPVES